VPDPRDEVAFSWMTPRLHTDSLRAPADHAKPESRQRRPWLGIYFRCCAVYGRIYRNALGTRYTGHCPRCRAEVSARIGPGGTGMRFFEAR